MDAGHRDGQRQDLQNPDGEVSGPQYLRNPQRAHQQALGEGRRRQRDHQLRQGLGSTACIRRRQGASGGDRQTAN